MTQAHPEQILKQVSRSFYLSIRILPETMRRPVGIAYLIARAADSMTDSDRIETPLKAQYLQDVLSEMSGQSQTNAFTLSKTLMPFIRDPDEQKLIQYLPEIFRCFHELGNKDHRLVQDVVNTLIQGMQKDLIAFPQREQISAFQNEDELEEYIYLVAGCVGEFWTRTAITHLHTLSHWDLQTQTRLGIEFGKALQLTNILRDVAGDARLGRCYLPDDELKAHNLNTAQLLNKENEHLFRPIIFHRLALALVYFKSAEDYLISTPKTAIRLRLASIWPILIGLKTLELIANKENFLDPEKNIKVPRKWVYGMLIRSLLIVSSNTLLRFWIHRLRQSIQIKINTQCPL